MLLKYDIWAELSCLKKLRNCTTGTKILLCLMLKWCCTPEICVTNKIISNI